MKRLMLLSIFSLSGCIGPKINDCLYDTNIVLKAVDNLPDNPSKEEIKKMLSEVKPQYCVPPDAEDDSKDFYRAMKTGDHVYDSVDWGILFHWINDHKK